MKEIDILKLGAQLVAKLPPQVAAEARRLRLWQAPLLIPGVLLVSSGLFVTGAIWLIAGGSTAVGLERLNLHPFQGRTLPRIHIRNQAWYAKLSAKVRSVLHLKGAPAPELTPAERRAAARAQAIATARAKTDAALAQIRALEGQPLSEAKKIEKVREIASAALEAAAVRGTTKDLTLRRSTLRRLAVAPVEDASIVFALAAGTQELVAKQLKSEKAAAKVARRSPRMQRVVAARTKVTSKVAGSASGLASGVASGVLHTPKAVSAAAKTLVREYRQSHKSREGL